MISGRQGRWVIKPHSQEGLETENKGQEKGKKRNIDRKQDEEVGTRGAAVAGKASWVAVRMFSVSSVLQKSSLCPVQSSKGVRAVGSLS